MKKLGFGLMRLPVNSENPTDIDQEQLNQMVDLFLEKGFTYFDTSYVYHNGESERAIRRALVERHDRDSFLLASKLPSFAITEEAQVQKIFEEQLEKCGVDYFDYFLLHNLNKILYAEDGPVHTCHMFEAMSRWKAEGRIKHLGFSFHDDAETLDRILTDHPEVEFVQIAMNYYDWDSAFIQAGKCYEVIRRHGKQVIVMEPVKGGMLAKLPEETEKQLAAIDADATPASWAVRFTAGYDGVLVSLSGMSTLDQVKDNISYMQDFKPLTEDEKKILFDSIPAFKAQGPLGCSDFSKYENISANGMPVAGVLDAYNSCMIQPNPYFAAENNYYKGVRFAKGIPGSWPSGEKIMDAEGNDITDMVKEAETFLLEHSF